MRFKEKNGLFNLARYITKQTCLSLSSTSISACSSESRGKWSTEARALCRYRGWSLSKSVIRPWFLAWGTRRPWIVFEQGWLSPRPSRMWILGKKRQWLLYHVDLDYLSSRCKSTILNVHWMDNWRIANRMCKDLLAFKISLVTSSGQILLLFAYDRMRVVRWIMGPGKLGMFNE